MSAEVGTLPLNTAQSSFINAPICKTEVACLESALLSEPDTLLFKGENNLGGKHMTATCALTGDNDSRSISNGKGNRSEGIESDPGVGRVNSIDSSSIVSPSSSQLSPIPLIGHVTSGGSISLLDQGISSASSLVDGITGSLVFSDNRLSATISSSCASSASDPLDGNMLGVKCCTNNSSSNCDTLALDLQNIKQGKHSSPILDCTRSNRRSVGEDFLNTNGFSLGVPTSEFDNTKVSLHNISGNNLRVVPGRPSTLNDLVDLSSFTNSGADDLSTLQLALSSGAMSPLLT
ncbi:unnamed protein product, partial [Protopolystoma xenopodis]